MVFMLPILMCVAKEIVAPVVIDLVIGKSDEFVKGKSILSEEQENKTDLLLNIYSGVAFADGVIDDTELSIIYHSFPFLNHEEIEKKIAKFLESSIDYEVLPKRFFKKSDRIAVWKLAYSIAIIDECYDAKEEALLISIANAFGFSSEEIIQFSSEVKTLLTQKLSDETTLEQTGKTFIEKSKSVGQIALSKVSGGAMSLLLKADKGVLKDSILCAITKKQK